MPRLDDIDLVGEVGGLAGCGRATAALASARPFPLTGDQPHYARDLVVDVRHINLEIAIDPKAKTVGGTATHYLSAINDGVRSIRFDAAETRITGVSTPDCKKPLTREAVEILAAVFPMPRDK